MNDKKGFCLFFDWIEDLNFLESAEAWKIIVALSEYFQNGTNPLELFEGQTRVILSMMMHQIKRSEAKAESGRKGANVTNKKKLADSMPTECRQYADGTITNTITETITNTNTITNISPPKSPKGDDSELKKGFSEFWEIYPRKDAKAAARKAFEKLKPDETLLNTIVKAVEAQKRCSQWQDSKYIPYASTWLNQRRWEDDCNITPSQRQTNTMPSNIHLLDEIL